MKTSRKVIEWGLVLAVIVAGGCVMPPQTAPPFEQPQAPLATLGVEVVDQATGAAKAGAAAKVHTQADATATDQAGYASWVLATSREGYGLTVSADGCAEAFRSVLPFNENTHVRVELDCRPPVPPTPSIPPHPAPIVGQFRTDGDRCFADDTGCRVVAVYHAGDMFALFAAGQVVEVREDLAAVAAAGYQIVRSWVSLNDGADPRNVWAGPRYLGVGPRITPGYQGKLVAFARLLDEYGLKWHMAAGGIDAMTTAVEEAMFRTWADAMAEAGPEKWALVEACNECRDTSDRNGDNEPAHLERLISIVRARHPQVLYTLTAYTGTEDPRELGPYNGYRHLGDRNDEHRSPIMEYVPGSPGSSHRFIYYHGYRGQEIDDKIRHRVSMALESGLGRLYWDGEPGGPWSAWGVATDRLTQVSAQDNDHEYDDESVTAMAMGSVIGRGVHAFMSSTGVRRYVSPTTFPGFATIPRLFQKIPQDAHTGILVHAGRANSPIEPTTNSEGHLGRADSLLLDGGRVVSLLYGERPGVYRFRLRQGLKGVLIHPGTAEETPIDLKAGETLAINMQWARVFVGRVQ